jgi:pimeloyl-ACP methyl ester carboxylesterase
MAETVILIPGIMGSQLFDGQTLVWPGSPAELLLPYSKMAQLLQPGLQVGDIIRSVSVSNQYASLVSALETCGFSEDGAAPTLRVCPYDWRKDNRLAAERLADAVRSLRHDHGADVVINLVAHSMGGLVSRYFLESGEYTPANCAGFENVRRLVTIGTPHRGAPLALCAALGQIKRLFLSAVQVKQLADQEAFPALYQLMPPPGEPFVWNTDPDARLDPASPYQADVARLLGLVPKNLDAAVAFHGALDVQRRPAHVNYFCFVGTRQSTIANVQADFAALDPQGAVRVFGVEVADGGDGTVPGWSASFSGMQQLAVGGDHGALYKTPEVLRTLGALLGKQGVLSSRIDPTRVRLSIRDEVVAPDTPEPVVLFFNTPAAALQGEIVVRRLAGSNGQALAAPVDVLRLPVSYQGAPIDSLALTVLAPTYAGVYALDLQSQGASIGENQPRLLVQQV